MYARVCMPLISRLLRDAGKCFDKCTAVLASLDTWKGTARIEVKLEAPRDKFCIETLLFATEERCGSRACTCATWRSRVRSRGRFVPKLYFLHGEHELLLEGLRPDEVEELQHVGMQTFAIDAGIIPTIVDLFDTVLLFKGNWTEQESFWFLKTHLNITYDARTYGDVDVPEDMIPDGSTRHRAVCIARVPTLTAASSVRTAYLATQRFDGTEVMIQYGTGSYSGHSTIALRINGSLHVCESTDKNSPPYWPPPYVRALARVRLAARSRERCRASSARRTPSGSRWPRLRATWCR
jgi:hypothetical protein